MGLSSPYRIAYIIHMTHAKRWYPWKTRCHRKPYTHRMHVYHVVLRAYMYYKLSLKLQVHLLTNEAIHLLVAHFTPRDLE